MTDITIQNKTETFFANYKQFQYKKGELLITPEKGNINAFYLKTGSVKMYALSEEGEELILQVFRPGAFFPFMIFMADVKNSYYFQTMESTEVYVAPLPQVLEFVKNEPEILYDLANRFAHAIVGLTTRLEGMVFQGAYHKIISLFLYLVDKFGKEESGGRTIPLLLNHQDIASWVGIRRETASRQLEILKKTGLVIVKDQYYYVPEPEKLRQELGREV